MSRAFLTFLLTLGLAVSALALEPGNTEKEVLATLGRPTITRQTANGVIWKFKDGTSVRFEGGVVKEVDGPGAAKETVRGTPDVAAPPAEVAAPAPKATSPSTKSGGTPASTPTAATSNAPATVPTTKSTTTGAKLTPTATVRTPYRVPEPPAHSPVRRFFGAAFLLLGLLAMGAGNIWLIIVAFKQSVGWGIACFLIPVVGLIFIIMHWADTKKILGLQLAISLPLVVLGAIVA